MGKIFYDLTTPQKSIYLTEEYYKNTNINNIAGTMVINVPIDFDKFILAFKQFVRQNDGCRIKLTNNEQEVKQWVSSYEDFAVPIIDVSSNEELDTLTNNIVKEQFSLYNSLLFKFVVFRFPDNHGGFIINMHHIISDSWTLGILVNEIMEIYAAFMENKEATFKDTSTYSYANYILSEQEYIKSDKYQKDKDYWREIFSSIPDNATIPSVAYSSNTDGLDVSALRKQLSIPITLLKQIKDYCNIHRISLFNFLTAIFSIYIGRVSNLDDFCIGTPILNRSNFKEKNTTGIFINTLPLRISIDNNLSFTGFLNSIVSNSMSLLRHQKYSYQNILEDLRKKQNDLISLYNIMISYQITKMNNQQETIPHESTWYFNKTIANDIDIHIFDLNDTNELNIAYDYKCSKYSSNDIEQIHNRILAMISQVLTNDNINLSEIEIVTEEEKKKLICEFNQTKTDYPKNKTVIQLFEEQVKCNPLETAVIFENQSLTYQELDDKANKLAYFLMKEKHIKPHTLIGIMTNRSFEMVIRSTCYFKMWLCLYAN